MLKTGVFQTPSEVYAVYEVTEPGFYRIDFVRNGGMFQTDIENLVYSQVHRKNTKVYGDSSVYELWESLRHKILEMKLDTDTDSKWENGVYKTTVTSVNSKSGCSMKVYKEMNTIISEEIVIDNCFISMDTSDIVYGVKLDPMNIDEYTTLRVDRSTLNTDNPELPYHSLETLRRTYDIEHLFKEDYVVADTVDVADKRIADIYSADPELLGVDTETTGLDVNIYGEDKIVGIILAQDEHTSTYFPFRMETMSNLPLEYMEKLDKLVRHFIDRTTAHNGKFDRKAFLREGFDYCFKHDSMQGSIVLNPEIKKGAHELKNLVYEMTGRRFLELSDIFVNKKDINFSILPKEIVKIYACPDSCNAIRLTKYQLKEIPKFQRKLYELECALSPVKADNEYFGMRVDIAEYEKQYKNCNYIQQTLLDVFRRLTRCDDNINSSKVLSQLIYGKMHCDVLSRTKTGAPSTSTAAINKLAAKKRTKVSVVVDDIKDLYGNVVVSGKKLSEAEYPALLVLSTYKKYNKLITAFYARFERTMKTGRVFFWINQNGAATGRQSSPMHQLPPALKKVILSDTPDHDLWGPDYSQVELRMIAYLANQKDLIELCKDPDNDIHRAIGSLILNCEMWEITPEERSKGKRRNFGVVYLISKYGLATQLFGPGATEEQIEFADKQLNDFYRRFRRIDRYIKENEAKVQRQGYMETKWLHRRRLFPEVFDPDLDPRKKASILRMGNNVPVQGTAADYLKMSEVNMYRYIREKGWYDDVASGGFPKVRLMLSIHDENLISAHKSIPYEEIIRMITLGMEIPVEGAPPFFVQPAKLTNWADHENDALPLPIRFRDKLILDYERTGVSVINEQNYVQLIKDFRMNQLKEYMDGLIKEYGRDYKSVGEHVRHPSLSHQLIDVYHDELKGFEGTQAEKITEATRLYLSDATVSNVVNLERAEDRELKEENEVVYGSIEDLVNFDENGEVVYEETDHEDASDVWYTENKDAEEVKKHAENKPQYAWELADTLVLDVADMPNNKINEVLSYVHQFNDPDGFFKVMLVYGEKLLDTGMRVESFDIDAINQYVIERINVA